ncbi:MAG: hypothetical protein ACMXYF_02510 [Candidatus Woesearchaeota archaeon]
MSWKQTFSGEDFLCYENSNQSVNMRIESRKTEDGWLICKSYMSDNGLNHTDEYMVATADKMHQVVTLLKDEKTPSPTQIKKYILEKSKKVSVKLEREFKEYNVEKWNFYVNSHSVPNFAIVRCYEDVTIDLVLHERYKPQEQAIFKEITHMLGLEDFEDMLTINCYYFTKTQSRTIPSKDADEIKLEFL